jgi:hypothetical protein
MTSQNAAEAADVAAKAGSLVEKVASAGSPARATLGRIGKSAAAVQLGARLLPGFWRFIKRHPVGGPVAVAALVGVAYMIRMDYVRNRSVAGSR